jgi:hypothetical protein
MYDYYQNFTNAYVHISLPNQKLVLTKRFYLVQALSLLLSAYQCKTFHFPANFDLRIMSIFSQTSSKQNDCHNLTHAQPSSI